MLLQNLGTIAIVLASVVTALQYERPGLLRVSDQDTNTTANGPIVNVGGNAYQGIQNTTSGLNTFKGIRYAAAPIGKLRWQLPKAPQNSSSGVIPAVDWPAQCPQAQKAPLIVDPCPNLENLTTLPQECQNSPLFKSKVLGNEDCLFLNIWSPQGKKNLPVFVFIHGGADGFGNGRQDLTPFINANDNSFVGITIQYRIGAFGFLASDEVARFGTVNAGFHDQQFALKWIQQYISQFGGDPSRVTLGGQSEGAGSILLHSISNNGTLGNSLFKQGIAASTYIPTQWHYRDYVPTQSYFSFASKVGCFDGTPFGNASQTIFDCLVGKDTLILQQASAIVDGTGRYGNWGMQTVTDDRVITSPPSQGLFAGKINGERMLIGTNADEGFKFTPQNVVTEEDLRSYLGWQFPLFTSADIEKLLQTYPSTSAPTNPDRPRFATTGEGPITALNQSGFGTGQQQRANNIYAEMTFHAPSRWFADAFSRNGRSSWMYQYSVPPAEHGFDLPGYFGDNANFGPPPPGNPFLSPDFMLAFMKIYGNFITTGNPSIANDIANGLSTKNNATNPASSWPVWNSNSTLMLNLNTTGGVPASFPMSGPNSKPGQGPEVSHDWSIEVPMHIFPNGTSNSSTSPLLNRFTIVNRATWEGGRGQRDNFWRAMAAKVPE